MYIYLFLTNSCVFSTVKSHTALFSLQCLGTCVCCLVVLTGMSHRSQCVIGLPPRSKQASKHCIKPVLLPRRYLISPNHHCLKTHKVVPTPLPPPTFENKLNEKITRFRQTLFDSYQFISLSHSVCVTGKKERNFITLFLQWRSRSSKISFFQNGANRGLFSLFVTEKKRKIRASLSLTAAISSKCASVTNESRKGCRNIREKVGEVS